MSRIQEPQVVILGGGFGGLAAARALATAPVRITLIDRANHHLFQPLLYQVATAALASSDIASPIRKLLRKQANTTVLMANVASIDVAERHVHLEGGAKVPYDYLIVATGMTHAYFGHDEWSQHAPGLKTLGEALELRRRILLTFEQAEREPEEAKRRELTTFVVIGAGPTGVEMAGALAEIARRTLAKDFRHFDPKTTRVVLIEAGSRVLPSFAPELSTKALASLTRLGVEVRLGTKVTSIEDGIVHTEGDPIRASTILWAAGVRASPLCNDLDAPLDRAGRVRVNDDLSIPGHPEVFAIGDLIHKEQGGTLLPGVAQLAIQSGKHAALQIERTITNAARTPFHYVDKGSMATIGRAKAIAEVGRLKIDGFFAWVLWLFIHLMFLVGFRNRVAVFFEWAWAYLTWQRSSRVIIEPRSLPIVKASTRAAPQEHIDVKPDGPFSSRTPPPPAE